MVDGDDLADVAGAGDGVGVDAGDLVGGALDEVVHRVARLVQIKVELKRVVGADEDKILVAFLVVEGVILKFVQV